MSSKDKRLGRHTATELRSRLPQEIWDQVSESFDAPSFRNMNKALQSSTYDYGNNLYTNHTPAYKDAFAKSIQRKFRKNRVPYEMMMEETNFPWRKGAWMISHMLAKGNISSAEALYSKVIVVANNRNPDLINLSVSEKVAMKIWDHYIRHLHEDQDSIELEQVTKAIKWLTKKLTENVGTKYQAENLDDMIEDIVRHIKKNTKAYKHMLKLVLREGSKNGLTLNVSLIPQ
jgi:hypothetical protein